MEAIKINDKFVASWGYDQTQYSIYEVTAIKGKSVIVRGLNGWSGLDANDLCVGSKVKVYQKRNERYHDLTEEERQAVATELHFSYRAGDWNDFDSMIQWANKKLIEAAEVRTIVKMNRVNGESWTYLWELDNGQIINSTDDWKTKPSIVIIEALKKCLVKDNGNYSPSIKIDEVIRAYHDPEYDNNAKKYAEQNEYTAYNGR